MISFAFNWHNLERCAALRHGMARRITWTRSLQGCPGFRALWPEQAVPLNDDIVVAILLSVPLGVKKSPAGAKGAVSTAQSQSVIPKDEPIGNCAFDLLEQHLDLAEMRGTSTA